MIGFIVFAHGSRVENANQAVRDVVKRMAEAGSYAVEPAFLELGEPDLAGAAARLAGQGVTRIVVIPYFLTLGTHLQRDLPRLVADAARRIGNVEMQVTAPLDGHPALLQALLDRASQAEALVKKSQ
ncbi:MAG TPA: CbiX/SirB N-terminal domain-containing protein [Bryobacteraceae bacterium]|nr:CbiX/SirB N-terminal domain-containing protein [Bryobacteraceae bacterium]